MRTSLTEISLLSGPIAAPGTGVLAIQSTTGNMVSSYILTPVFAENKARTCKSGSDVKRFMVQVT